MGRAAGGITAPDIIMRPQPRLSGIVANGVNRQLTSFLLLPPSPPPPPAKFAPRTSCRRSINRAQWSSLHCLTACQFPKFVLSFFGCIRRVDASMHASCLAIATNEKKAPSTVDPSSEVPMESREYDNDRDGKSGRRNHRSGYHRAASTSPRRHRRKRGELSVDVVFAVAAVAATSPRKVRASHIMSSIDQSRAMVESSLSDRPPIPKIHPLVLRMHSSRRCIDACIVPCNCNE